MYIYSFFRSMMYNAVALDNPGAGKILSTWSTAGSVGCWRTSDFRDLEISWKLATGNKNNIRHPGNKRKMRKKHVRNHCNLAS